MPIPVERSFSQVRDIFCASISQELEREFTWRAEPFVEATYSSMEDRVTVRARVFGGEPVHYTWGHWQLDMESMGHASRQIAHELAAAVREQPRGNARTWNQNQQLQQEMGQWTSQARGLGAQLQAAQQQMHADLNRWTNQVQNQLSAQMWGQHGGQVGVSAASLLQGDITGSTPIPLTKVQPTAAPLIAQAESVSALDQILAEAD